MYADPIVVRHTGDGRPVSEETSWLTLMVIHGHWLVTGYGAWAIVEKSSGRFIGDVGFTNRKRDWGPGLAGVPEMGWALVPSAFGKGYATEAARAALAWARGHFGPARVFAITAPENAASIHVAEKCGFAEFKRGESSGRPRIFFDRIL